MSPRRFERVQGLRRIVYDSEDYAEGIRAFKDKRKPKHSYYRPYSYYGYGYPYYRRPGISLWFGF
jgi:hypothetical protein